MLQSTVLPGVDKRHVCRFLAQLQFSVVCPRQKKGRPFWGWTNFRSEPKREKRTWRLGYVLYVLASILEGAAAGHLGTDIGGMGAVEVLSSLFSSTSGCIQAGGAPVLGNPGLMLVEHFLIMLGSTCSSATHSLSFSLGSSSSNGSSCSIESICAGMKSC